MLFERGFSTRDCRLLCKSIKGERVKREQGRVTYRFMPWELLEAFGDRCTMQQMAMLIDDHLIEDVARSTRLIAKQDDFCDTGFVFLERDWHRQTYSSQYFWRFYCPTRSSEELEELVFKRFVSRSAGGRRLANCTPRLKVPDSRGRREISRTDYIGRLVMAYASTAAKALDAASYNYEVSQMRFKTNWQRPMVLFRAESTFEDSLGFFYPDATNERLLFEYLARHYPRFRGGDISLPEDPSAMHTRTPAILSAGASDLRY
jgi:hypothetical protein